MNMQPHKLITFNFDLTRCYQFAYFLLLALFASILFYVDSSSAATTITGLTKAEALLKVITTSLTGPIAKGIALVAIISLGFAAWSGRLTGALAIKIIVGIVIILGAAEFVTLLTGTTF